MSIKYNINRKSFEMSTRCIKTNVLQNFINSLILIILFKISNDLFLIDVKFYIDDLYDNSFQSNNEFFYMDIRKRVIRCVKTLNLTN